MKTNTKSQIIDYIEKNGKLRPADLMRSLGFSQVAIQKQLKRLCEEEIIQKTGKPPLVFYVLRSVPEPIEPLFLDPKCVQYLDQHYGYVSPDGTTRSGVEGFALWLSKIKQKDQAVFLANEYIKIRQTAEQFRSKQGWIEGIHKFKTTFPDLSLDQVYYQDFYSLPKFGRSKIGHELLLAKQAQNKALIENMAVQSKDMILKIIKQNKINTIAWTPHSIPRKVQFLKEFRRRLNLGMGEIEIVKAYAGGIPIAQKSLSKLEERIDNARNTIFIKSINPAQTKILIIDDAVGSGATLNEIGHKLRAYPFVKLVIGFVLVGSYKGFEVIKEV